MQLSPKDFLLELEFDVKEKIKIGEGALMVFMGSMNAMPMMYAWELKRRGFNVLYFVDAPVSEALSRPENHFPEISYPYPDWIIELNLPTQMMLPYCTKFYAELILKKIKSVSSEISCFFLNGFFISLAPRLKQDGQVVCLSHGSDLDVWANKSNIENLANSFCKRSIFKYLPARLAKRLIRKAVAVQYAGASASDAVIYFPAGFNDAGDSVVKSLAEIGVKTFERYDISFEPLRNVPRDFKPAGDKLILFSGVRFLYRTFPDGNYGYSKGNDLIIRAIAEYHKGDKNIEVHFVEKGEDVQHAKDLCRELGLADVIVWHKEMPFSELIKLYIDADVCFDQVGPHWMGAIGGYALFLGKPLIANVNKAVELGVFPSENPILSVQTEAEIFDALVKLKDEYFRRQLSAASKEFVEREMGCGKLINDLLDL